MSFGRAWFCAVAVTNLKHTLERPNHNLLEKLRALGKRCCLIKIIQLKYFRTALGCLGK